MWRMVRRGEKLRPHYVGYFERSLLELLRGHEERADTLLSAYDRSVLRSGGDAAEGDR